MLRHAVRPFFRRRGGLVQQQLQLWPGRAMSSGMSGDKQRWVALWGNGDFGRLGLASTESCWKPTVCKSMQNLQPVAVACGGAHTLVLTGSFGFSSCLISSSSHFIFAFVDVFSESFCKSCNNVGRHSRSAEISMNLLNFKLHPYTLGTRSGGLGGKF